MTEHPQHAELDKAFDKTQEESNPHTLFKPSSKDFKLHFDGVQSQAEEDGIPLAYYPYYLSDAEQPSATAFDPATAYQVTQPLYVQ